LKGRLNKPKSCPECGGDLKWNGLLRLYTCTSCGIEMTEDRRRELSFHRRAEKKDRIKEYVDWWLSKK